MGLNIRAISAIATQVTDPIAFDFHKLLDAETDSFYVNADFPNHTLEFEVKSGEVKFVRSEESEERDFHVGSYSTYNKLRNLICLSIHGVKVETVWDNEHKYAGTACWDLLNFSDCEGAIDSKVSAVILKDLEENRDNFISYLNKDTDIGDMDTEHYTESYDNLIKCFELGADGGVVLFG